MKKSLPWPEIVSFVFNELQDTLAAIDEVQNDLWNAQIMRAHVRCS
ncbi:hypothetical protein [Paracoccus broussonetiae]|nr:hypothetical protein [Paracoccus sp. CPCC 101403]